MKDFRMIFISTEPRAAFKKAQILGWEHGSYKILTQPNQLTELPKKGRYMVLAKEENVKQAQAMGLI